MPHIEPVRDRAQQTNCQYATGPCNQTFDRTIQREAFFIFSSQPPHLASTVREAIKQLQNHSAASSWLTWEELKVGGHIIFCEICKAIWTSRFIVADITTLNFNVFFEIGYSLGIGKPVLLVRDSSYERDKRLLDEVGIFDTLGYKDFTTSVNLASLVTSNRSVASPITSIPDLNREQPIYYVKAPIDTDGSLKIVSSLNKSYFRFRTFDFREVPRLSLHEAHKQVLSSFAVVAHLSDPNRNGAVAHNARAAFVCGLAMAAGKHVLMLQEGLFSQPVDFRDVVVPYTDPAYIPRHVERLVRAAAESLQTSGAIEKQIPLNLLERVDLGDVAAENEVKALARYFVRTPQFQQARQGHARLVIGRKGSGKTAVFYGIRKHVSQEKGNIILDLKPEGHQFTMLREVVLKHLSEGTQEHTVTAFWHYLLLLETAQMLIDIDAVDAWRDPAALEQYHQLERVYQEHAALDGDFSERLAMLINRLVSAVTDLNPEALTAPNLTGRIYAADISKLSQLVISQQALHGDLWILFDNIDKGFPSHGLHKEDILIVRCLLEATRKIQRALEKRGIQCASVVFIRRDVYDLLIDRTPDRGKESHVNLDWSDTELVKELLLRRFQSSVRELTAGFDDVWAQLFEAHVSGENSFRYILSRTFLRPRDILNLTRKCVQIAVSRGHDRVSEQDIKAAEAEFSEDMLNETKYEIRDVFPDYSDIATSFIGAEVYLSRDDASVYLLSSGIKENDINNVLDILLWFCFMGVMSKGEEHYCYQVGYNKDRLKALIQGAAQKDRVFVIHPAFRHALMLTHNT